MFDIFPLKGGVINVDGFCFEPMNEAFLIRANGPFENLNLTSRDKFKTIFEKERPTTSNSLLIASKDDILKKLPPKIAPLFIKSEKFNKAFTSKEGFYELCLNVKKDSSSFNLTGVCQISSSNSTTCLILTDTNIPKTDQKELLKEAMEQSFGALLKDEITNDNVIFVTSQTKPYDKMAFKRALNMLLRELFIMSLRDSYKKIVVFEIKGAKNSDEARAVVEKLKNSDIEKMALILQQSDMDKVKIYLNDLLIYSKEQPNLSKESQQKVYNITQKKSFKIVCDLGVASSCYTAYQALK